MKRLPSFRQLRPARCYSLVEMLVTVAIIAILVALLFPTISAGLRIAKDTKCKQNLKQLNMAYLAFAQDNDGNVLSDVPVDWTRLIQPYIGYPNFISTLPRILCCPSVTNRPSALWWQPDYGGNLHGAIYSTNLVTTAGSKWLWQTHPGEVISFLDWIPGWRFARSFEFARVNDPGQDKSKVYRHNGKLNAVFLDGHIESIAYPISTVYTNAPWR